MPCGGGWTEGVPHPSPRFLAAATDCSSYFKLGVKGTTFQKCEHTSLCYAPSWVCDGANDCGDYSDERNCPGESGRRRGGSGTGGQGRHSHLLAGSFPSGSVWAAGARFARRERRPLPVQLRHGACCRVPMDARARRVFGEESFGVGQSRAHPRHRLLVSPSQTRGKETQVPSQLLRLPKREVHPHDLDL